MICLSFSQEAMRILQRGLLSRRHFASYCFTAVFDYFVLVFSALVSPVHHLKTPSGKNHETNQLK